MAPSIDQERRKSTSSSGEVCTIKWDKQQQTDRNQSEMFEEVVRIQIYNSAPIQIRMKKGDQEINIVEDPQQYQQQGVRQRRQIQPQEEVSPNHLIVRDGLVSQISNGVAMNNQIFGNELANQGMANQMMATNQIMVNQMMTNQMLANQIIASNSDGIKQATSRLQPLNSLSSLNRVSPNSDAVVPSHNVPPLVPGLSGDSVVVGEDIEPPTVRRPPPVGNRKGDFVVSWKNLSYTIQKRKLLFRSKQKKILNDLNGYFKSGQVTAMMGPSGAGKSTLIDCITGQRVRGVVGEVRIKGAEQVMIGTVPQSDNLLEQLTIKESLVFAAKLRFGPKCKADEMAVKIIKRFKLTVAQHTKAKKCSGGQRKRLSIALEILAEPNILILDEPTTGLDSPSCTQVVSMMLELARSDKPTAVVTTIHQPSVAVFESFDQLYILSKDGQCMFQGRPIDLIPSLAKVGLNCPRYHSPADYVIEIASDDFGHLAVERLVANQKSAVMDQLTTGNTILFLDSIHNHKQDFPFFYHLLILFRRTMLANYRDVLLLGLRLGNVIFAAVSLSIIFGDRVGKVNGCPPSPEEMYLSDPLELSTKFEKDMIKLMENVSLLFVGIMVGMIGSIAPMLVLFPTEMLCFIKEHRNGWYSPLSYFFAKVISEVPHQLVVPGLYVGITYPLTGQPPVFYRGFGFYAVTVLTALTGQALGQSISAIWCDNINAAVFAGGIVPLPLILFGGFLVKVSRMPKYFKPLSWLTFLRFSFEALLLDIYGFNRCSEDRNLLIERLGKNYSDMEQPKWVRYLPVMLSAIEAAKERETGVLVGDEEDIEGTDQIGDPMVGVRKMLKIFAGNIIDEDDRGPFDPNRSLLLAYFGLRDFHFYRAVGVILFYLTLFQVATYFVLRWKLTAKR